MAAYRNLDIDFALYFAVQTVLELEDFDPTDASVVDAFDTLCSGRLAERARPVFDEIFRSVLVGRGFVMPCGDGLFQKTQKACRWGSLFQLSSNHDYLLFGRTVEEQTWPILKNAILAFLIGLRQLRADLSIWLKGGHSTPVRLDCLLTAAEHLVELPKFLGVPFDVEVYQRVVALACRDRILVLKGREEELESLARDRHVLEGTVWEIQCLESFLALPEFDSVRTAAKPRVTDFVNVGVIEASKTGRDKDEKFGILSAPTLFSDDFVEISEGVFSRGRSFAVGFIDIDHFKKFNSKHGETVVDQVVLPQFMRALEGYCYGRAYAYRQGGDEYLVLLRNADKDESRVFFEGLQAYIAEIDYPGVLEKKPTVSIGVHVIDGNHEVTVFEGKKLANEAKDKAKKAGRNCVRLSTDPGPEPLPVFWRRQQHLRNHRFRKPLRRPK